MSRIGGDGLTESGEHHATGTTERESAAWSRYWARGALHSCANAFPGNYGDEVRELWEQFFAGLPQTARVLDIGTGNGAVAFIARDAGAALGKQFAIEGIDAADIDPHRAAAAHGLALGEIVFRGRTPCERTGYPSASFDAVSSQFALEYTRVTATLAELARILTPAGRALFVIHHTGSVALAATRAELDTFNFLKHEAPIIVEARRLIQRLAAASNPNELDRLARDQESRTQGRAIERMLRRTVERARSRAQAAFLEPIAAHVAAALREVRTLGPIAALQRLDALHAETEAHRDRLASIQRAAHTAERISTLTEALAHAGFVPEPATELKVRGSDLLGWVLRATRATSR